MFLKRFLHAEILRARKHFPVVLLTGPRQTGKTALLQNSFPKHTYHSFDALDTRDLARRDPRSFFTDQKHGLILDEIQSAPELLTYVKEFVDHNKNPGQVILTGSQQFSLMKGVTESLAGRVAILQLLPFCFDEVADNVKPDLESLILRGFYPQVCLQPTLNLDLWFSSYISTYLERDLRAQVQIRDMKAFEVLLKLLATRIGQELNMNRLATDVGVTAMTIKAWISALEAAYIIYLMPPYFNNFGKRVVKSPKIYFVDTGLVCHLLKIQTKNTVLNNPMAGALFENFVVVELLKLFFNKAKAAPLYYWRSHDGLEVDVIIDHGLSLTPVEIKLAQTVTDGHIPNLAKFKQIAKKASAGVVISQSQKPALSSQWHHYHWSQMKSLAKKEL